MIKTHEIRCRFTNHKLGEFTVDVPEDVVLTNDYFGVDDARCDQCKTDFGDFKEMIAHAEGVLGDDYATAKARIEAGNWKKNLFLEKVEEEKEKRKLEANNLEQ